MTGVSVVVPTYDEGDNAHALLHRLDAALAGRAAEILFVDDGSDDLPEIVAATAVEISIPVRVIRRPQPVGRLGGAVVEGITQSRHDIVVVCDGDLQHPPELIPQLVDALHDRDVVVASRYVGGGDSAGLSNAFRQFVSRATGMLVKIIFPLRLQGCSDPMSGFFAIRRSSLDLTLLRPRGFKILLEIMARSNRLRLAEVPFSFAERLAGESHASAAEGLRFIRQVAALRVASSRAMLFTLVGVSGVLPNLLVLWTLAHAGVHYLAASFAAVQAGVLWNFVGAELFVWRDRKVGKLRSRFAKYLAVGETDLVRLPFVLLLVSGAGLSWLLATLLTMFGAFVLRFVLIDKIVYSRRTDRTGTLAAIAPMPPLLNPAEEAA
ncbi:MAG: dolichol-phosphate mannosyltransferase [Acidobacteriota bacterium]|jgi:dolichol-phosphate mannosyltransferase